jgi:hypothetical protein
MDAVVKYSIEQSATYSSLLEAMLGKGQESTLLLSKLVYCIISALFSATLLGELKEINDKKMHLYHENKTMFLDLFTKVSNLVVDDSAFELLLHRLIR